MCTKKHVLVKRKYMGLPLQAGVEKTVAMAE